MHKEDVEYICEDTFLKGYAVYSEESLAKRPGVIVAHAWKGQDDFAKQKAEDLARLGYIGFAADLYGEGIVVKSNEEALSLMLPLFLDRQLLRARINAAFKTLQMHPMVDPNAIGAIGFCFGGLTVIELLRSGADVRGVVSFHGVLGNTMGEQKAQLAPDSEVISGSLLILHGNDDPLVSHKDIISIQQEFTKANVDWQMHIYGHCQHAFTNPEASDTKAGLVFNAKANDRSWQTMCNFFDEIFTEGV